MLIFGPVSEALLRAEPLKSFRTFSPDRTSSAAGICASRCGRKTTNITAITDHGSNGSEANTALNNAAALSFSQQQDLVNFLRSL